MYPSKLRQQPARGARVWVSWLCTADATLLAHKNEEKKNKQTSTQHKRELRTVHLKKRKMTKVTWRATTTIWGWCTIDIFYRWLSVFFIEKFRYKRWTDLLAYRGWLFSWCAMCTCTMIPMSFLLFSYTSDIFINISLVYIHSHLCVSFFLFFFYVQTAHRKC